MNGAKIFKADAARYAVQRTSDGFLFGLREYPHSACLAAGLHLGDDEGEETGRRIVQLCKRLTSINCRIEKWDDLIQAYRGEGWDPVDLDGFRLVIIAKEAEEP